MLNAMLLAQKLCHTRHDGLIIERQPDNKLRATSTLFLGHVDFWLEDKQGIQLHIGPTATTVTSRREAVSAVFRHKGLL